MQSLITNLLGPIFYGMGVSEADFASYLSSCMGYVYGILAALIILILVLIIKPAGLLGKNTKEKV